jgi:hypothetical protein
LIALGFVLALGIPLSSCKDDFLTESPPHIIVPDNLYTDFAGFEAGLNGLYAQVRSERDGTDGLNQIRNEMWTVGTDNAFSNYVSTAERIFNTWGPLNTSLEPYYLSNWTWLYQTINAANTIILRADNPSVNWTPDQKNEVVAEARLIRAWCYRHLNYLWGDVPLNLVESSGATIRTDWARTPKSEVFAQMEQDLVFAEANLPETQSDPGKLVKAVAQHYLAELYLRMGEPAKAETEASAVINSGLYSLVTQRYGVTASSPGVPFMDQFVDGNVNRNQGNTEVLWAFELQENIPGGGENIMRRYWLNRYYSNKGLTVSAADGGRGIGRLSPTAWAINLYEPSDDRGSIYAIRKFYLYNDPTNLPSGKQVGDTLFLRWVTEKNSDPLWPSTRKWDWTDPLNVNNDGAFGDQPYLRLAQTYLLLAEAQFDQNEMGAAANTLNTLRARAHASQIGAGDVTADFILDEDSREMMCEGDRRYTLLRMGKWLERTRLHNPMAALTVAARDTLFPIPQAVIDANLSASMAQNPGY